MFPAAVKRSLTIPPLDPAAFKATKWDAAEVKARFGDQLLKFVANDFPKTAFKGPFYNRLSNTFGHIAHYNMAGFYETFFTTTEDQITFVEQTLQWPCWGDPEYTYSDVERQLGARLRASGVLAILKARAIEETRRAELATLARLKNKYEPGSRPPPEQPILLQSELFAFPS